jgi:hypothetical protein
MPVAWKSSADDTADPRLLGFRDETYGLALLI